MKHPWLATVLTLTAGCGAELPEAGKVPGGAVGGPGAAAESRQAVGKISLPTSNLGDAYEEVASSSRRVAEALDAARDGDGAGEAASRLKTASADLTTALRKLKTTVAGMELAGRKRDVVEFYQKLAEKGESLEYLKLFDKIEVVVNGPQGPALRGEINDLLDGLLEASTSGDRRHIDQEIQRRNLRR